MASTKIYRTLSTPTNTDKGTISLWLKKAKLDGNMGIVENFGDNNNRAILYWNGNEQLSYYDAAAGDSNYSTAKFRDLSGAWMHIVLRIDSSQASASDRVRTYINGNLLAVNNTIYQQNENSYMFNSGTQMAFGTDSSSSPVDYMEGVMSHIHYCDGQSYAPTEFGETDATTGEWKIKTSPSVTYGSQGFFILKDGNSVTDQSGNGNNFTVSGTFTNTEDCPSNVFATWNPLYNPGGSSYTFSNGNTKFEESGNQWKTTFSTLSAASGKYYAEFKCNGNWMMIGVADMTRTFYGIADRNFASTTYISEQGYGYYNADGTLRYRGYETSYGATYGSGDIIGVALDCDNNRVFFSKNGTWQNSADPTNASTGFSMTATNARYAFAVAVQQDQVHANFGNGYFSTTAVASAGTNASGNGIFEYDVPTGYTALSTKGLNL
jgi:hypothetical protein|tara:strand:- start:102 stop:1409 length:1308 start_codon:yes stop_codon:yes gene_type:complete